MTSPGPRIAGGDDTALVPLGIGIDTVEVARFRSVLARRPGLGERLFSSAERSAGVRRADPAPGLAAGFAAKEATMKALGVGLGAFSFREVEVLRESSGAPRLRLAGVAADLAGQRGVSGFRVSLTHTATVASAVVLALGELARSPGEDPDVRRRVAR